MESEQRIPETFLEAVRAFSNPDVAHEFFVRLRWPNGVACPRPGCGSASVAEMPKYKRWYCNECKKSFTAKVGTVFEDSPIGFDKWLPAIWLLASSRNGISSCELARSLGVTQKTAWFILHRVRLAMQSGTFQKLVGTVEADESYIGGKSHNKPLYIRRQLRSGNPTDDKTMVFGVVQRGGDVRAWTMAGSKPKLSELLPVLRENVHEDATFYTDSASLYKHINEYFLKHSSVNHSALEYVRGSVHTNTIESFWAVLKRTISGTYIAPRAWHLDRYLDEQIFRFNERKNDDGPRFIQAVKGSDQKRLTYRDLTAAGQALQQRKRR